tara:strand:- start:889 stop:1077 length:189 start_codon:yes stop_codon:yes gene_type:complete
MTQKLLSLATLTTASLIGSSIGTGLWLAVHLDMMERETKMSGNTKCQPSVYMKPVTKENQGS